MLKQLTEKRKQGQEVLQKAFEENSPFSKMAEQELKMEQIKENHEANLAAIIECLLLLKGEYATEVSRKKELQFELPGCSHGGYSMPHQ